MYTRAIIVVLMLYLSGCASSRIDFTGMESLGTDEGTIVGRVQLFDKEEEQRLSSFGESMFRVLLVPENKSETIYVPLKGNGTFVWHLPAGNYTIASFDRYGPGEVQGRIFASFKVNKNMPTYIGTLVISFNGLRYRIAVTDDYQSSLKYIKKRFPEVGGEMIKSIMYFEEPR